MAGRQWTGIKFLKAGKISIMGKTLFDSVAQNYGIYDRVFTCRLTGAEVLAVIAAIQILKANYDQQAWGKVFGEAVSVVNGIIAVVGEVDPEAADQLRNGWEVGIL
jgi:hypothetical protein